jgi:hypothetical protein
MGHLLPPATYGQSDSLQANRTNRLLYAAFGKKECERGKEGKNEALKTTKTSWPACYDSIISHREKFVGFNVRS